MKTRAAVLSLKICLILLFLLVTYLKVCESQTYAARMLVRMAMDLVKESYRRIDALEFIKQDNSNTPGFEVGFLLFVIYEKYRKMLDKYNTSMTMQGNLYQMELIMYLTDVELNFWELDHIANMLHEVERKYNVNTTIYTPYIEKTSEEIKIQKEEQKKVQQCPLDGRYPYERKKKKRKRFVMTKYLAEKLNSTVKKNTRWWWPIEYGWEIDDLW